MSTTLTCHTSGCANAEQPIQMDLTVTDPLDSTRSYVDAVQCGVCRQPITDVQPPFTPGAPA